MTEQTKPAASSPVSVWKVLRSRRVLASLAVLLVGLLTLLIPELQAVHDQLVVLIVTLALMLIGGVSIDEAARIAKERNGEEDERLREVIKELLSELFEEMVVEQTEKEKTNV